MSVFILANCDAERYTIGIKRVFSSEAGLEEYVRSIVPVGGIIPKWMKRENADNDWCVADIDIKYPDESIHAYKVFRFDVH